VVSKNSMCSQGESVPGIQFLESLMRDCDIDHGVIKLSVPGTEFRFQNYINESHVFLIILSHFYYLRLNLPTVVVGGMHKHSCLLT
jgi:hypothetical protein